MTRNQQQVRNFVFITLVCVSTIFSSCSANCDDSHTTATTYVSPPSHQLLTVVSRARPSLKPGQTISVDTSADIRKPLLIFDLENGETFHVTEEVPIDFTVLNAKLTGEGGEYRVRYIVDDDDMQLLDKTDSFGLSGWVPGKHTIRMELIGPDGWPYKNGNANVVTREIIVK